MINIYVVGGDLNYIKFIPDAKSVTDIKEADIVLFTGGEDVSPELYEETNTHSFNNFSRDQYEITIYKTAKELKKPCLGICRGSQFLTVMNNGKLIQDVDNHAIFGTHLIRNFDKEYPLSNISITSTHHQMMYPFNLDNDEYKLLAISTKKRSTMYLTGFGSYNNNKVIAETEIVYYPKTNCLAIQGHPEQMELNSKGVSYCNFLIKKYLLNEKDLL